MALKYINTTFKRHLMVKYFNDETFAGHFRNAHGIPYFNVDDIYKGVDNNKNMYNHFKNLRAFISDYNNIKKKYKTYKDKFFNGIKLNDNKQLKIFKSF